MKGNGLSSCETPHTPGVTKRSGRREEKRQVKMSNPEQLTEKLERAMRLYQATGYRDELRPAQWQALRHFATAPAEQRTVSGLARARASTMGTTSITVSGLVDRGLLRRGSGTRNVGLRLTDAGLRLLEQADPARTLSSAIAEIPDVERTCFDQALSRIIRALEPGFAETL
jgi:DNA-binding MarR family transcriptional regulator